MSEVWEFLLQEMNIAKENKEELEQKIHAIDIQIDFTEKAIDRIVANNDNTGLVFMSERADQSFDGEEIKKLNEQKQELLNSKSKFTGRISDINKRVVKLEKLLKEKRYEDNEKLNSNESDKVYNIYEVLYMQEADRQRIARDIHDTVVQGLTVLIHKNEFIEKIFETDRQRAKLELEKNSNIIRDVIDELRNIIFDLRPMSLDDLGFEKTFYAVIEKMKSNTQMIIRADYLCKSDKIDPVVSITAIRIIQELCTNSIKYSDGSKINIAVNSDESNNLIILYSDNGKGYDINNDCVVRKNNTGFGLVMMKERINLLNGTMKVIYEDNKLMYSIAIPLAIK